MRHIDEGTDGYDGVTQIYNGTLIVYTWEPSGQLAVPVPWRLDAGDPDTPEVAGGSLNLFGSARVSGRGFPDPLPGGSPMLVGGSITASGAGIRDANVIMSPTTFESTAKVTVAPSGYLFLEGETTYEGGTFLGEGFLVQQGDAFVHQPTTIGVSTLDMDGPDPEGTFWTLEANLNVHVDRVDRVDNTFDGTIHATRDSTLSVVTGDDEWEMAGLIDVQGSTPIVFRVGGVPVKLSGALQHQGLEYVGVRRRMRVACPPFRAAVSSCTRVV